MWRFCCPLDPQDGTPSCHRTRFTRSLHAALLAPAFARSALPRERVRSLAQLRTAFGANLLPLTRAMRKRFAQCEFFAIWYPNQISSGLTDGCRSCYGSARADHLAHRSPALWIPCLRRPRLATSLQLSNPPAVGRERFRPEMLFFRHARLAQPGEPKRS